MILMLFFLFLSMFFIFAEIKWDWEGGGITAAILIVIFFIIAVPSISYNSYLNLVEFRDGDYIEHKVKAIRELKKMIERDDNLIAETKNGYYESLAQEIRRLNDEVNWYNNMVISKQKFNDNIIFSWFIVSPDDNMKIIKAKDYQY